MSDEETLTRQQIRRKRKFGEPILPEEEDETKQEHRHIIAVELENTIGALNRVTNLFSARGFNLDEVLLPPDHAVVRKLEPGVEDRVADHELLGYLATGAALLALAMHECRRRRGGRWLLAECIAIGIVAVTVAVAAHHGGDLVHIKTLF